MKEDREMIREWENERERERETDRGLSSIVFAKRSASS